MNKFITSTRRKPNVDVIIYGSSSIPRMTSFGPRNLFRVKDKTILEIQLEYFNNIFDKPDFIVCGNYEVDQIIFSKISPLIRIIENTSFSNECEDIRLALNVTNTNKSLLLINGATIPNFNKVQYDHSFLISGDGELSINHNNEYVEYLTFNKNPNKWQDITFIHRNDIQQIRSLLNTRSYNNKFLFELINSSIESNIKFKFYPGNSITINNTKQLREYDENIV